MLNKTGHFIKKLEDMQEAFVVGRIIETNGSAPRKEGATLVIGANGMRQGTVGGGRIEAETEILCKEAFETKAKSKKVHFKLNTEEKDALDMGCGGEATIEINYVEKGEKFPEIDDLMPKGTVYIFGAGHVGEALEPLLRYVDFETVVIDDRSEFANREKFKEATEVKVIDSFKTAFEGIETDEDSYIVIVTRGHMGDKDVVEEAIKRKSAYIGMIGSRKKTALLYEMLEKEGADMEKLAKVYTPIGENIYAETPEEIGISIAAEMIKVRALKEREA